MSMFKKCTAIALACTLVGGTAVQIMPMVNTPLNVYAAEIDDEFIVIDNDTGENISSNRMIDIFNTPGVGNEEHYIDSLTTENVKSESKSKTVTEITRYMAKDLTVPDDFVGLVDSEKYQKYVVCEKGYETHIYLITTIVKETITEYHGDDAPDDLHKFKVTQVPAGTYNLAFTKEDGQTYRTFVVNVKQTAKALKTTYNYVNSTKEYNISTESGAILVANHTIQLKSKVSSGSTDELQYRITNSRDINSTESSLATITQDGVITTLDSGTAYLEITHKNKEDHLIPKIMTDKETGNQELTFVQVLPEYYPLYIVKENPAKEIKINNKYSTLKNDEKKQLTVTVTPTFTEDEYPTSATDILKWSSSNTKVVKVSDDGLLTAVGAGEATVTVMGENNLVKDSFVVKVTVPVSNLEMQQTGVQTYEGMTEDVSVVLKPNYADETVYWKSSDESVVSVEGGSNELVKKNYVYNAKLIAKNAGTATVTAYTSSGIQSTMTVTVSKLPEIDFIKLMYGTREIKVNNCSIFVGQKLTFTMTSMAGNIEVPFDQIKVTISKGGKDIAKATINKQGVVNCTGIARGNLKLYFKSTINPALQRVIYVNIKRPADYVDYTVNNEAKKSLIMFDGDTAQVKAVLKTKNADGIHDDVISKYKSSDTSVATVDSNGKITAKGEGTATISVKTSSSQEFKLVTVTVIKVSKIEVKKVENGVFVSDEDIGKTLDLDVSVYDNKNKRYTDVKPKWTLDNAEVLSVTSDNKLKVNKLGSTIVTCTIGGVSTKFTVKLGHQIKAVKYTEREAVELAATVKPSITLTDGGLTLKEGVDYTVDSVSNPVVGKNTTLVHGKGNYTGDVMITFYVKEHSMTETQISGVSNVVYTGSAITQKPVVKFRGTTLKEGTDYTVSYSNNKAVGTASITFTGKGNYKDTYTKKFNITACAISKCKITVEDATYNTKTGVGEPKVTVKFGSTTLKKDKDYTLTLSNNKKLGNATVTIKGIGNFNSSVSKSFKVISKYPLKITVPASSYSISVNGKKKLTYTVADAAFVTDKSATFKSDNKKIAKVDSNGVVTGVAKGTATITIDAHGAKATVKIYVK